MKRNVEKLISSYAIESQRRRKKGSAEYFIVDTRIDVVEGAVAPFFSRCECEGEAGYRGLEKNFLRRKIFLRIRSKRCFESPLTFLECDKERVSRLVAMIGDAISLRCCKAISQGCCADHERKIQGMVGSVREVFCCSREAGIVVSLV